MDKEKQIEDLTAIIDSFNIKTYENAKAVAKFLIEKYNYRKINENEVVISKEGYEKLKEYIVDLRYDKLDLKQEISEKENKIKLLEETIECIKFNVDFTRKKTAEKILKEFDALQENLSKKITQLKEPFNRYMNSKEKEGYEKAILSAKSIVTSFKSKLAKQFGVEITGENIVIIKEEKQKLLKEMYEQGKFDAIADLEKDYKVVISKGTLERLFTEEEVTKLKEYARKETAREIFNAIKSKNQYEYFSYGDDKYCVSSDSIEELAKQFGVDLGEEQ
jgi:hypothetical protein